MSTLTYAYLSTLPSTSPSVHPPFHCPPTHPRMHKKAYSPPSSAHPPPSPFPPPQMHQMAYSPRFDDDSVDGKALPNPGEGGRVRRRVVGRGSRGEVQGAKEWGGV